MGRAVSSKAPAAFLCVLCSMSGCVIVERSTCTWSKTKVLRPLLPLGAIDDGQRAKPTLAYVADRTLAVHFLVHSVSRQIGGHMTWISCPPGAKMTVGIDLTPERSWVSFRTSGSLRLLLQATESEQADACRVILALH